MAFRYLVHGLTLDSGIELPDLTPSDAADVDVRIFVEAAHERIADQAAMVTPQSAHFSIADVGRFEVVSGQSITVFIQPGADMRDVRTFLLGSAMGLLLHQRHRLALHAAAGVFDGRAVAFVGPSGIGKSTLALAMTAMGLPVLSDDLLAIEVRPRGALAHRAVRRIRVCPDALAAQQIDRADLPLSYPIGHDRTKYDLQLGDAPETAPLAAVITLADGNAQLERLDGADALDCLMANSFRGGLLAHGDQRAHHFQNCAALAGKIVIGRLCRARDHGAIAAQLDEVRRWLEQGA
nr:hypothetical protein [uncultured Sphingomonas sp.]